MLQFRLLLLPIGLMLCTIAVAMLFPALVDFADDDDGWKVFSASSAFTVFAGGLLVLFAYDQNPARIGVREAFLLTALLWAGVAGFAALPFLGYGLNYADAYFEAMSGLTTTGATVMTDLDNTSRGVLLWRALLNAIGGLGIIVIAIIMLPFLRVGGMQLFQAESSERSEKVLPRAFQLTLATAGIFAVLVIACTALYTWFGMTGFDAICHAFSTVATGGFSTHDASFNHYGNPSLHWTATLFMISLHPVYSPAD